MRQARWLLGGLMGAAVLAFGLQLVASETGEVVVLHTRDGDGGAATRLWVVDHEGRAWLRSGSDSGWYRRLVAHPEVGLDRDGLRRRYRAEPEPRLAPLINRLMAEKYGWREDIVSLFAGSREDAIAIRLVPLD